jgi:preprotein translocase subunit SecG
MFAILLAVQVLVSIGIIALVLLQQGKGADMGAGFGSGASGTVFGARGSGSFLTRSTAVLAAIFFINCLLIASPLVRETSKSGDSIADRIEQQAARQKTPEGAAPGDTPVIPSVDNPAGTETGATKAAAVQQPAGHEDVPAVAPATPAGDTPETPAAVTPGKPPVNDLPQ